MSKIGIGIDYSNVCKNYNTMYLDRDNNDRATIACMSSILRWGNEFFSALLNHFGYQLYSFNGGNTVTLEEMISKRFLFYSLEKEITLQSFIVHNQSASYNNFSEWEMLSDNGIVVQNDEEGSGIYLYTDEGSAEHLWITEALKEFTLEERPLPKH